MNRVLGSVAVVTGAAMGIGRAAAIMLAREGAKVAVADVNESHLQEVVKEITAAGGVAEGWVLDVTDEMNVQNVMSAVERKFGAITVLVNNAGIIGVSKPTHEVSSSEWDDVINVNVKGVFLCTKYVIPSMFKAGHGSIINLSSIYGLISATDAPPYHASKGAVRLMTKTDALFYAPNKIRVNSIHPGFIDTPMVDGFLNATPDAVAKKKYLVSLHPLGHLGEADDIAQGVLFLASEESKFMTGSELVIDGGYTAR